MGNTQSEKESLENLISFKLKEQKIYYFLGFLLRTQWVERKIINAIINLNTCLGTWSEIRENKRQRRRGGREREDWEGRKGKY